MGPVWVSKTFPSKTLFESISVNNFILQDFYDSDEQELGDLCQFYAEQEDFSFDETSAVGETPEELTVGTSSESFCLNLFLSMRLHHL